jgi:hypothetical protein
MKVIPQTVRSIQIMVITMYTDCVKIVEILGASLEEAYLKKREKFLQLIFALFCEVKRGFVDR